MALTVARAIPRAINLGAVLRLIFLVILRAAMALALGTGKIATAVTGQAGGKPRTDSARDIGALPASYSFPISP